MYESSVLDASSLAKLSASATNKLPRIRQFCLGLTKRPPPTSHGRPFKQTNTSTYSLHVRLILSDERCVGSQDDWTERPLGDKEGLGLIRLSDSKKDH
jgi:hypothetical protein